MVRIKLFNPTLDSMRLYQKMPRPVAQTQVPKATPAVIVVRNV